MTINKERIQNLEESVGGLQGHISRMELGVSDKLYQLEVAINKISKVLLVKPNLAPTHARERSEQSTNWQAREHSDGG